MSRAGIGLGLKNIDSNEFESIIAKAPSKPHEAMADEDDEANAKGREGSG